MHYMFLLQVILLSGDPGAKKGPIATSTGITCRLQALSDRSLIMGRGGGGFTKWKGRGVAMKFCTHTPQDRVKSFAVPLPI